MIILLASTMFSGMVILAVRKHQQREAAKAVALAKAQKRRQLERQQRPY
jgi:Flp pilus assembly protein protease CpaA